MILAKTIIFIFVPFTIIKWPVGPSIFSFTLLASVNIVSYILSPVREGFIAKTILHIVSPITNIFATLLLCVSSLATVSIVSHFTFIDITITMYKFTLAMSHIMFPHTFVSRTTWPLHYTNSWSKSTYPLSRICCLSFIYMGLTSKGFIFINFIFYCFLSFMRLKKFYWLIVLLFYCQKSFSS